MRLRLLVIVFALLMPATVIAQEINPATVHVVASPNVMGWPVTTRIASLEVAADGIHVAFDRCAAWPAVTPPGWEGPLVYTLWMFMKIGGEWYGSGIIQFWDCATQRNGGPIYQENQIARNWVYGTQWSPMTGHQPAPGERIGFMVSAGNARMQDDHQLAERSAIVEVAMPGGPGLLPFLAVEGTAANLPPPVVTPPPPPAPPPVVITPTLDLSDVSAQLAALNAKIDAVNQNVSDGRAESKKFFEQVKRLAPVARTVLVCESDGQIVKPSDVSHGRHVSERDAKGRIVTLCGYVHRVRLGSGTALGPVGDVK